MKNSNPRNNYWDKLFKGADPESFEQSKRLRLIDTTKAEEKLWQILRNRQIENCKFRRQHPINRFIADFYCHEKKLVIEVDGGYHKEKEQKEYDEIRSEAIKEFGIKVIRCTNEEVLYKMESVIKKIITELRNV